jgi:hypothetical protein
MNNFDEFVVETWQDGNILVDPWCMQNCWDADWREEILPELLFPLQSMIDILPILLPSDVPASPLLATGSHQDCVVTSCTILACIGGQEQSQGGVLAVLAYFLGGLR